MGFLSDFFFKPYPSHSREEVEKFIEELIQIGKRDDFLAERPGAGFNTQCRNIRARQIGTRLHEIGGMELMEYVQRRVRRKTSKVLSEHLEYAWDGVGRWKA